MDRSTSQSYPLLPKKHSSQGSHGTERRNSAPARFAFSPFSVTTAHEQKSLYLKDREDVQSIMRDIEHTSPDQRDKQIELHEQLRSLLTPWPKKDTQRIKGTDAARKLARDIRKPLEKIGISITNYLKNPCNFNWEHSDNTKAKEAITATTMLLNEHNIECSEIETIIRVYDFCYIMRNITLSLLYGETNDHSFINSNLTKPLGFKQEIEDVTDIQEKGFFKHFLGINPSKLFNCFLLTENPIPLTCTLVKGLSHKHLYIYTSLSKQGCQKLCQYLHQQGVTDCIDIFAGTGYLAHQMSECELPTTAVHFILYQHRFHEIAEADAIQHIERLITQKVSLNTTALIIAAPSPSVGFRDINLGEYLPELYKRWHAGNGGPVILFSECCNESELQNPAVMQRIGLATKALPNLPTSLIDDLGEMAGTAKAFTLAPLKQKTTPPQAIPGNTNKPETKSDIAGRPKEEDIWFIPGQKKPSPAQIDAFKRHRDQIKGALPTINPLDESRVAASPELVAFFKQDIQQPAQAICQLINQYLTASSRVDWIKAFRDLNEILGAITSLEALQAVMSGQPLPETRDIAIFPDDIRFKAMAGIYNYCASLINEGSLLLYGQSSTHNIQPKSMLKNLAVDATATKLESLPDAPYPNALVYEESDAYRDLFTKENPLAKLANSYSNFINEHLHIRFALSKQGCDALLDYLEQYNVTHIVDIMAGRGYTKRLLTSSGFKQINVLACDTAHYDFTFAAVDSYLSIGSMDAVKYIKKIINCKKSSSSRPTAQACQPDDLSQFALMIAAPPAAEKQGTRMGMPMHHYLSNVYSVWHESNGGPVCLFSEITNEKTLHDPEFMQLLNLKTVDLPPFPDRLLNDLGDKRGIAKAFTVRTSHP